MKYHTFHFRILRSTDQPFEAHGDMGAVSSLATRTYISHPQPICAPKTLRGTPTAADADAQNQGARHRLDRRDFQGGCMHTRTERGEQRGCWRRRLDKVVAPTGLGSSNICTQPSDPLSRYSNICPPHLCAAHLLHLRRTHTAKYAPSWPPGTRASRKRVSKQGAPRRRVEARGVVAVVVTIVVDLLVAMDT
ncbi:hypothetical protein DENSPDRAFT_591034 [Dentipellis sp. KUC8613]|nr:hypothetical protein DENSPDRAFT_591034 [Dentipellis sp. KUC8613]